MTGDGRTGERAARPVEGPDGRYRAAVAWTGPATGRGLVYFLALDGDGPHPDDRRDRRALLEPGTELAELTEEELAERLRTGAPLTGTERRFTAPDGRIWLAQSVGPVWADEEPAEGSTGTLFTSLEGPGKRLRGPGADVGDVGEETLVDLWRRGAPDGAEEADGAGEGGEAGRDGAGEADAEDGGA